MEVLVSAPQRRIGIPQSFSSGQSKKIGEEKEEAADEERMRECSLFVGTDPSLHDYFLIVEEVCQMVQATFRALIYWAALLCLTSDELNGLELPPVSEASQQELLLLFQPTRLSSVFATRNVDGVDEAVIALVDRFCLKVPSTKLEALAMVWKYNAFSDGSNLTLYLAPSLINHSCAPNCDFGICADGRFSLIAGENGLLADTELSISYLPLEDLALATHARREHLAQSWLFFCRCTLCLDSQPSCNVCQHPFAVLLSNVDDDPYLGRGANCDDCTKEALSHAGEHFYYFHCRGCEQDICPPCGVMRVCPFAQQLH